MVIKRNLLGCCAIVCWNSFPFRTFRPSTANNFFSGNIQSWRRSFVFDKSNASDLMIRKLAVFDGALVQIQVLQSFPISLVGSCVFSKFRFAEKQFLFIFFERKNVPVEPLDILVSFDVIQLFTMLPLKETLYRLTEHFFDEMIALFHHVLTKTALSSAVMVSLLG